MSMKHKMKLASGPYHKLATTTKIIESRLYDLKRQGIDLGDEIEFSCQEHAGEKCVTRVIGLLRYRSFEKLFQDHKPELFGGKDISGLLSEVRKIYSVE